MKFIAEIGWNFVGDLTLAEQMIKAAAASGADYAKFQVWNPKHLKPGPWDEDGRREIYQKAYLDKQKITSLKKACDDNGIAFLASVFEQNSLSLLRSVVADAIKIPSHECNNYSLIDAAKKDFGHVILSIGAVSSVDLDEILHRYGTDENVTCMHCVSTYPLDANNINFPRMLRMKARTGSIGYSSHYTGIQDAIAAAGLGVSLIEKHFTVDQNLPGRDNKFALLPSDFEKMVFGCREVERMMNDQGDEMQDVEKEVASMMRGRWNG